MTVDYGFFVCLARKFFHHFSLLQKYLGFSFLFFLPKFKSGLLSSFQKYSRIFDWELIECADKIQTSDIFTIQEHGFLFTYSSSLQRFIIFFHLSLGIFLCFIHKILIVLLQLWMRQLLKFYLITVRAWKIHRFLYVDLGINFLSVVTWSSSGVWASENNGCLFVPPHS